MSIWFSTYGVIARSLVVGIVASTLALTVSVAFGQGGKGGGGRSGGPDHRSNPSDYYRGSAPPPPQLAITLHGGQYLATDSKQYEIVFMPLQTRIYAYDDQFNPLSAQNVHVQMSLQVPGESKRRRIPFRYLANPPAVAGQDYVVAVFDVADLNDKETPITVEFSDLPSRRHPTASFTPLFTSAMCRRYVVRVLPTKADADAARRQRICPVDGNVLGSQGPAVKVLIGEYPLYLCSKDCIATVREAPEKYLPSQLPVPRR